MKRLLVIIIPMLLTSIIIGKELNHKVKESKVKCGADLILTEYFDLIKGKRLGIVTNHSALTENGAHLVDTLFHTANVKVTALFGPEHGIRGDAPDGATIANSKDPKTGIQVYSLYGSKSNKPTKEMLKDVDVLIYDIQDVGARFYTFISTLFYTVQAAAENNIPLLVLDRPNPINGVNVDGPVRKEGLSSFVGIAPIPIMHGMTIGELAKMFNESGMIGKGLKADLTVVKMKNWERDTYYDQTELKWVNPSPNIPNLETAIVYPGVCLIEGTNVSEGRGTYSPFLTIGAPFINSKELISELEGQSIKGISLVESDYTPVEIKNMASQPKFQNKLCHGIKITIKDRKNFNPVEFGIKLLCSLHKLYPSEFKISDSRFDRLSGDKSVREKILSGTSADKIISDWQSELNDFKESRKQFLLY